MIYQLLIRYWRKMGIGWDSNHTSAVYTTFLSNLVYLWN